MERVCLNCGINISGRTDKKFCSYNCRSYYNNSTYRERTLVLKNNKDVAEIMNSLHNLHIREANNLLKVVLFVAKFCERVSRF